MTKIFIASEFRCHVYKDKYYLSTKAYSIYKRYSDAFGEVILCSRFIKTNKLEKGLIKADFIKSVIDIQYLYNVLLGKYNGIIKTKIDECDLVIGRLPSIIAYRACDISAKLNKPYMVELMCDGWKPYWNHGMLGKFVAPYMYLKMKKITYNANYAIYVTEKYLQKYYPCKSVYINASNVTIQELYPEVLNNRLLRIKNKEDYQKLSLMTSANVDLLSKGQEYVVKAINLLKQKGIRITYFLAGSGDQKYLLEIAKKYGVDDCLVFLGKLTLEEIFERIDNNIDIYIQPSLQEGLPRAVIEAMSRACPCLGARTAGIPELLDDDCIFKPKSAIDIAETIQKVCKNGLTEYAIRNFNKSKEFVEEVLNVRRNRYFNMIKAEIKE